MFLGMQDFDFAQFALILPESNQICPNLANFAQNFFAKDIPSSYGTGEGPKILKSCDVILLTFFSDVMTMMSLI